MTWVRTKSLATVRSGETEENERIQEMPSNGSSETSRIQDGGEGGVQDGRRVVSTGMKNVAGRAGVFGVMSSTLVLMSLRFLQNNQRLVVQLQEMYLVLFYRCMVVKCPSSGSIITTQFLQELLRLIFPHFFLPAMLLEGKHLNCKCLKQTYAQELFTSFRLDGLIVQMA